MLHLRAPEILGGEYFDWQFRLPVGSPLVIASLVISGFGTYPIFDVSYRIDGPGASVAGDVVPSLVTRSLDGNTVTILFGTGITPGLDSMVTQFWVGANSFDVLASATIYATDGSLAAVTTIEPTGPVVYPIPEVATYLMIGGGLAGIRFVCLRRPRLRRSA
jgi:hypothetical protein